MDKVKQILEMLRKHHFWILCGVAGIVGLVAWYLASGKLQAEFATNATNVSGTLKKVTDIPGTPQEGWKDQADRKLAEVKKSVKGARDKIYERQKKEIFTWPKALGDDFVQAAEKLEGTSDKLSVELRERYLDWVKNSVQTLATTVDAAMPNDPAPTEHKVVWPQILQIQQTFDWEQRPSTVLVKYAQEELWVYEALCKIVAKLNETAQGAHEAMVKEITTMDIAYLASEAASKAATKNRIQSIAGTSVPVEGAPPATVDPNTVVKPDVLTRGKRDLSAAPAAEGAAPLSGDDLWKTYRYVDDKGEAITAVAAEGTPSEYNLMPFRLLLKMDRRGIDKLLLECRNSPLPIEVQQVRINPSGTTTGAAASYGGGGGGGGSRGGNDHGRSEMEGGGRAASYAAVPGKQFDRDAVVEVRGVVYLLQPEPKTPPPSDVPPTEGSGDEAVGPGGAAPDAAAPANTPPASE